MSLRTRNVIVVAPATSRKEAPPAELAQFIGICFATLLEEHPSLRITTAASPESAEKAQSKMGDIFGGLLGLCHPRLVEARQLREYMREAAPHTVPRVDGVLYKVREW